MRRVLITGITGYIGSKLARELLTDCEVYGLVRKPLNLEYLEDHYGIRVDEERYAVFYSAFADNLMPDVTVVVRVP